MKRIISLILMLSLVFCLCACGAKAPDVQQVTLEAFEAAKEAYQNINAAYEIVKNYGLDIYEAWRIAIYYDEEIIDEGCSYLAKELNLSQEEIEDGVLYSLVEIYGDKWDTCSDVLKGYYRKHVDSSFGVMKDDLFSWCTLAVSNAYNVNGKADTVKMYLDTAKGQMREMSKKYSDYEHYPALKGYYTTVSSYFDLCQNPTGSFEQLKTTFEDYSTRTRDFNASLDYIFED